ncbi:MAG: serpin family protein [Saprospiraceae bacterium]|nr:serpin family protein [Saprospiraceae bacterium]
MNHFADLFRYSIIPIFLLTLFSSCEKSSDAVPQESEINKSELLEGIQDFQWSLFKEAILEEGDQSKNVIISPLSVASALYMALRGADNQTRAGMERALALEGISSAEVGMAYQQWISTLTTTEGETRLSPANAIFWDKQRILPEQSFLTYAKQYFDADTYGLDFGNESALDDINQWVNEKTENRITKILDEIRDDEVMFILNALFFTSDWKYPFPLEQTAVRPFSLRDGSIVEVPTMHQDIATLPNLITETYQAVDMPFADSSYRFTMVLPPKEQDIDDFIGNLNASTVQEIFNNLKSNRILLNVPKFSVSYKILLNEPLKRMGMQEAFDPNLADFTKLGSAPEGNLFLSKVLHKTFLKVDEKGAEGAAVTSIGVGVTSLPPMISFNRPFLFMLWERETNTIVFIGKMEDPGAKTE